MNLKLKLKRLTPEDQEVFKRLLGSTEFGGCFCAVWTSHDSDWDKRCADSSQPNFKITADNLKLGRHIGYLVYSEGELVGWTGSGPKSAFPLMQTKLGSRLTDSSETTWSIGCLAVSSEFRGKNIAEKIVRAVIDEARANGATTVEAYPVRPFHEPRMYRGSHKLFDRLGFKEVGCEKDGDFEILALSYLL